MDQTTIEKQYLENRPFSFGGKYRLYDNFGKVNKTVVNDALRSSDIYSRFYQYKKPRRYSPIFVDNKRELFQCDLIAFTNKEFSENNDGYLYLFTTIDVFSKYAWVYKLKNKECKTVMDCFKDIISKCGKKPQRVQTDRGTEFVCKAFKKYFRDQGIHHYVSYSDRKCPVIERFNLTIQQLITRIMDQKGTQRWIDCIDKAMKIYLNRMHNTIKMSPQEAELKKNESLVRRELYNYFFKSGGMKWQKAKYKKGDTVRVWKYHRKFKRGYEDNFTKEYFKISKVLKNLPVVRYKLQDINGEEILGSYFQEELVPYTEPEFHKIIIVDTKGIGVNKKFLIKYDGWDDKYNRWVKAKDMVDLNESDVEDEVVDTEMFYENYNNSTESQLEQNPSLNYEAENQIENVTESADNYYEVNDLNSTLPLNNDMNSIVTKRILGVNVIDDNDVDKIVSNTNKKVNVSVIGDNGMDMIDDIKFQPKEARKQNLSSIFQSSTRSRNVM